MKSVATLLLRSCLKQDSSASDSLCRGYPGSTGILEISRRHASIDAKSRKSLVYKPIRQRIISPGLKSQRSRRLANSRACREQMEDVDVLCYSGVRILWISAAVRDLYSSHSLPYHI